MSNLLFKRHSATILTCIGAAGVIVTTVLAIKATPKAMQILEEEKNKGNELTFFETIKTTFPVYIPTIISGVLTIACIFGSNALNKTQQAALMSAYALLDNSYKQYTNKVEELHGEETSAKIKEELAKDNYEPKIVKSHGDKELFFDFKTMQYFESTLDEVVQKVKITDDGPECYIISTPFDSDDMFIY